MVLGAGYSLWLLNRLLFGNAKTISILYLRDLTRIEFVLLFPFIALNFILGIYPEIVINFITVY
jgi:NADH-quinone oxidoreductase subunit M